MNNVRILSNVFKLSKDHVGWTDYLTIASPQSTTARLSSINTYLHTHVVPRCMLGNRQNTIAFRTAGENEYGELRVSSGNDGLTIDYSDAYTFLSCSLGKDVVIAVVQRSVY